jgi:hypothetical protein
MSVQLEVAAVLPYQPNLCAWGPLRYTSERPAVTPVYHRQPARPEGHLHKAIQSQSHSYHASHLNSNTMTTHELENEPVVALEVSTPLLVRHLPRKADGTRQDEHTYDSSEDAIPREKSGVKLDPNFVIVMLHFKPHYRSALTSLPAQSALLQR